MNSKTVGMIPTCTCTCSNHCPHAYSLPLSSSFPLFYLTLFLFLSILVFCLSLCTLSYVLPPSHSSLSFTSFPLPFFHLFFIPFPPSFPPSLPPSLSPFPPFPHRGNKSTKTVKHFKRIPEGTHQHDMMKHAAATLGSGNLRLAVQLPEGEDLNEWIAVNS